MPLYEYACKKCGKVFEVMQKFSEEPLTVHAECGGTVERLLSAPALHFKGSGFYITDYAKGNGNANSPGKNSETKASSEGSDGSKSDASKTPAAAKSDSSKADSGGSSSSPAPAPSSSSSDAKS